MQEQRIQKLIAYLREEDTCYADLEVPKNLEEQKRLLRALVNVRSPKPVSREFLDLEAAYLAEELAEKGVVELQDIEKVAPKLYLWQGDITRLAVDAIVNAANFAMLGCFVPCHGCIDNAIHTAAGVELRLACAALMEAQGGEEATGKAKLTPAFHLPSKYILHTVGPIVHGGLTQRHREDLTSCYKSCLALAEEKGLKSVAFCCISTGEFCFPNDEAAAIAIKTVKEYQAESKNAPEVIFNVYKEQDLHIYQKHFEKS